MAVVLSVGEYERSARRTRSETKMRGYFATFCSRSYASIIAEGIDRGVVDVGREHAFFEIVEDDHTHRPAQTAKRALVELRPRLRARLPDQQTNRFAGVAERQDEEACAPVTSRTPGEFAGFAGAESVDTCEEMAGFAGPGSVDTSGGEMAGFAFDSLGRPGPGTTMAAAFK